VRRVLGKIKGILETEVKKSRRKTLYRMLQKKNNGIVPWFHLRQTRQT